MDDADTPSRAIAAFETVHRLTVTVHDLSGVLWPVLPPQYLRHRQQHCDAVKAHGHDATCRAHDGPTVYGDLAARGVGRVHVCHAGFVEWAVPEPGDGMAWILFAGLRRPGPDLDAIRPAQLTRLPPWPRSNTALPLVGQREAGLILESLHQLAARIRLWTLSRSGSGSARPHVSPATVGSLARRQGQIRHFIREHHAANLGIDDLARHLGLSPSRTSHAVVEACGQRFVALLTEARLRTAASLLRHTALPVETIAARSGFGDLAHFHRVFRGALGLTPARYRADAAWPADGQRTTQPAT